MDVDPVPRSVRALTETTKVLAPRKVLLVDPLYHIHSILYYRAALGSDGFGEVQFTVLTTVLAENERERLIELERQQPRLKIVCGDFHPPIRSRWQAWNQYGAVMQMAERMLADESFDLLIYLMVDFCLPFLAFRSLRRRYPRHYALGVRGLAFRSMGLRPVAKSWKAGLIAAFDRFILRRALQGGALRKLSFLDRYCADRARQVFRSTICGPGIDPVEIPSCDKFTARQRLEIGPTDFIVLMFGSIDERKGVIESLALLRDTGFADREFVVVIAGQVVPELKARLEATIQSCADLFRVVLHDQFITNAELPSYFTATDCIICPYKNFTASSGVLLHGASCGKPALVSPGGAMEDAVREFGFGDVVSLEDPEEFVASLRRLMRLEPAERAKMSAGAFAYARSRDARLFMGQFLTEEERKEMKTANGTFR